MERNKLSESCDHKWKTRSWSISYGISQTGYSLLAGQCNLCFMYVWIFEIVKLRLILPLYWLSFQFCLKNIAQQGILFGRSYISEEYLQNLKETVQSNNLSQSFVKIQCMHLKCWEKKPDISRVLSPSSSLEVLYVEIKTKEKCSVLCPQWLSEL